MIYNATSTIAEVFDRNEIRYHIEETDDYSAVLVGFHVECGPSAMIRFVSINDDCDVSVCITGILNRVSSDKRAAVLEVCNKINHSMRFLKFLLDDDADLIAEYDFPVRISEDNLGECCMEIFIRSVQIINRVYHLFPEAIFGGEQKSGEAALTEVLQALKAMKEHPLQIKGEE